MSSSTPPQHSMINEDAADHQFWSELHYLVDDSWSLYPEILQSTAGAHDRIIINEDIWNLAAAAVAVDQPPEAVGIMGNGSELVKIINSKTRKKINRKIQDEEGPSDAKKLDHNAKERIRRMKLNASFLALRALLPDSRRSKKRRSAPAIVDRVLEYIPELENEVQALRSNKETLHSAAKNNKLPNEIPSVSFSRINRGEAVVQICMHRVDYQDLLQTVEDEAGIFIKSASTLHINESLICCHLHIQLVDLNEKMSHKETRIKRNLICGCVCRDEHSQV